MPNSSDQEIFDVLQEIAPLELAEDWDNVGLIVEGRRGAQARKVLLAIDGTEAVLREAIAKEVDLLIAYHPPIFSGLKKLTRSNPRTAALLDAIAAGVAIYSPHTALDAAPGGLGDWMCRAFENENVEPIELRSEKESHGLRKVVVFVPRDVVDDMRRAMSAAGAGKLGDYVDCSFEIAGHGTFRGLEGSHPAIGETGKFERVKEARLEMLCRARDVPAIADAIKRVHPYEEPAWESYAISPRPLAGAGQGRRLVLTDPLSLGDAVTAVKQHWRLEHVRVAAAARHRDESTLLKTVALCAGSGGSVIGDQEVDLLLTGEMRHHDVLAAVEQGRSVILLEHTNSERGYLPEFAARLRSALGDSMTIEISEADREPLQTR